jgi:hypothetical protein
VSGDLGRSSRTLSAMMHLLDIQWDGLWMLGGCRGGTFKGAAGRNRKPLPIHGGRGYPSLRMDFTSLMGQPSPAGITRTFLPAREIGGPDERAVGEWRPRESVTGAQGPPSRTWVGHRVHIKIGGLMIIW